MSLPLPQMSLDLLQQPRNSQWIRMGIDYRAFCQYPSANHTIPYV